MFLYRGCLAVYAALLAAIVCAALLAGCGEPGSPQPPSLNLPNPVHNLTAERTGNTVHLEWTTTNRTTDHTPVSGTIRTHVCRVIASGPCELVTDLPLKLGQPSHFDDALPTDQLQGQPQLLTYYVELLNHARKSAGRSNPAYSASGPAAAELTGLTATVRPEGVELQWNPGDWPAAGTGSSSARIIRLKRVNQAPAKPGNAGSPKSLLASAPQQPTMETLEVAIDSPRQSDRVIDRSIGFGETYRYQAQPVEKLTLQGHSIEIAGPLSSPVTIFTRDTFPPAVPEQLAAVADSSSHAIDLSWSPDHDPDLAGYYVYRQEPVGQGREMPVRISGSTPLAAPAFHDANVKPGLTYAYTVTAVDQSGNESKPSNETDEALPLPQ